MTDIHVLNSPKEHQKPFRGACAQFTTDEVFETQEIASLRIHVERSIGKVKNFHILDGVLPLTLQPISTQIFQVLPLIVISMLSVLKKNATFPNIFKMFIKN
jgi:hypothetical protein